MTARPPYFDTSAIRPLLLHEVRSLPVARALRRSGGVLHLTRFGYSELLNSMACAVFRRDISADQFEAAAAELEIDLKLERIVIVDLLWRAALDRSSELSREYAPELGCRMLDILHLASALELGAKILVSYDKRQIELAKRVGLKTISP